MQKKDSQLALILSLVMHTAVFGGITAVFMMKSPEIPAEQVNSISMEMMSAMLEQPPVAVSPPPEQTQEAQVEEVQAEPEAEPEKVVEPEPLPTPKPVEKPKEKPKPKEEPKKKPLPEKVKPKEKPKEQVVEKKVKEVAKPIKALETGIQAKPGIVAKAMPDAVQGTKVQAGQVSGNQNTQQQVSSSSSEFAAYTNLLKKTLQSKANNIYPPREKMMRKQGVVNVQFTISSSGQLGNVSVISSSGNSNLDNAAIKSVQSTKMPPPPAGYTTTRTVPIRFGIED